MHAHYVLRSLATFEETLSALDEMLVRRRASMISAGICSEEETEILGFAYAAA